MKLIQLFLPLNQNDGTAQPGEAFRRVREELLEAFRGLTVYQRSPAQGLWEERGCSAADEMLIFEVMVDSVDHDWWKNYRSLLEARFNQKEVLIRSLPVETL